MQYACVHSTQDDAFIHLTQNQALLWDDCIRIFEKEFVSYENETKISSLIAQLCIEQTLSCIETNSLPFSFLLEWMWYYNISTMNFSKTEHNYCVNHLRVLDTDHASFNYSWFELENSNHDDSPYLDNLYRRPKMPIAKSIAPYLNSIACKLDNE